MPHDAPCYVSKVTRRNIFDALSNERLEWWGRLTEAQFLGRIFDLESLPSTDFRYRTAAQDIVCHREWNSDWNDTWIFLDERFELLTCSDATFFKFLTEMTHPEVQPDPEKVGWLIDVFNQNLAVDGWALIKRREISGRPTFEAQRLRQPLLKSTDKPASDEAPDQEQAELEGLLATLCSLFTYEGSAKEVAVLANSTAELRQTDYDNWNGGTCCLTLYLKVPVEVYTQVSQDREVLESAIKEKGKPLFANNEYLEAVSILPTYKADPKWREKAKASVAGTGITNQGRVRSDNIASRQCDGLLFRSRPEINLYKALKAVGVSFTPLPVFIQGGQSYRRIEPDFVIVKDGIVLVVEVDGDTVHRELPAEADDRTKMLKHEGAHIERVSASRCETLDLAAAYAQELLTTIKKIKRSHR